ncbi:MAG: hypothetical protein NTX03_12715 [Bacteroidetes bacterium]|nr:hypothetical protein [Bacteroidota bacterium]
MQKTVAAEQKTVAAMQKTIQGRSFGQNFYATAATLAVNGGVDG